jgi:hypothetical protein
MVKIHLEGLKGSGAVGAQNATQFAEQCQVRVLSSAPADNLSCTVARVESSVGCPLIPKRDHARV